MDTVVEGVVQRPVGHPRHPRVRAGQLRRRRGAGRPDAEHRAGAPARRACRHRRRRALRRRGGPTARRGRRRVLARCHHARRGPARHPPRPSRLLRLQRGRYGWLLSGIKPLAEPLAWKGAQGLWNVPAEHGALLAAGVPCPRDTNGDGDCGRRLCPYRCSTSTGPPSGDEHPRRLAASPGPRAVGRSRRRTNIQLHADSAQPDVYSQPMPSPSRSSPK